MAPDDTRIATGIRTLLASRGAFLPEGSDDEDDGSK